uniref:Ig-like domain-containing protein n=1 Tax=Neogobius melanostomus TaxID=47308 RepID=A0A8C6UEU6_9GOBI
MLVFEDHLDLLLLLLLLFQTKSFCVKLNKDVITAETGLCAVIHCSFSTPSDFYPSSLAWFKCEPGRRCTDSDIMFHSKNKNKIQSSFLGRPDLSQRNCSIIINDLQLSDSGTYHFRVNRDNDGFSFTFSRATVSVKALQQKPTVQTPALTEGQHSPTFTWTWRGAGDAPPNVTTATTDRLTPVDHRHRHSSTLWLTASAELHGAELSCTVSYKPSSSSTQDSVRINVTYVKDLEVSGDTVVKEGDSLNVTCSVDSFPPSRLMWFGPNKTRLNVSETTESSCQTDLGSASLLIHNVTQAQSGQYMCEGLHLNSSQTRDSVFFPDLRKPVLVGHTSVEEGSALNLTCTVDSFPPSNVTVRKSGLEVTKRNETRSYKTDPGSASLVIMNVTPENTGIYECTVQHELKNQTTHTHTHVEVLCKKALYKTDALLLLLLLLLLL